jgi:spore coat protein U-like protein
MGTVVLTCRGKTGERLHYRLRLTAGQGSFQQRIMRSGSDTLSYNLYLDAARTQVWGDGTNSTGEVSGYLQLPGPVYSRLYPVYARLSRSAAVRPEAYSDSVAIQLEY